MLKARIAVFVSGGGTNLQALLDAEKAGKLPSGEIALVVSNKAGVYALERASAAGVESAVIPKKELGQAEFEKQLVALLEEKQIDLIVLAGFLCILSQEFVKRYPRRIINIHPSLIPAFCGDGYYGLRVHEEALKKGVKVTGATVHFVNEITDGGEILFQKAVEIPDGIDAPALQKLVMEQAEWLLLPMAAEKVSRQIIEDRS
ncbi:MAG: phosphoribosylglycinamide formyltransferase [Ruminococcaceae bacterium]|nr:phosphoribosylglycinamide formyltransferase [Oscillospiraceae bacterium]